MNATEQTARVGAAVAYVDDDIVRRFTVAEILAEGLFRLRDATGDYITTNLRHPRWTLGDVADVVTLPVRPAIPRQRRRPA